MTVVLQRPPLEKEPRVLNPFLSPSLSLHIRQQGERAFASSVSRGTGEGTETGPFTATVQSRTQGLASRLTATPPHPPHLFLRVLRTPVGGGTTARTALRPGNWGPVGAVPPGHPKCGSCRPAAASRARPPGARPGGARMPELAAGWQAADVSHARSPQGQARGLPPACCQSCQTISLPGFYENLRITG